MSSIARTQDQDSWFDTDVQFHNLYPLSVRELAARHWTPLHITRRVTQFLTPQEDVKVLDIGSGVGKFCLTAAYLARSAFFFGIEQRKDLVVHAETARKVLGLENIHFMHGNFTQLDLGKFDHFYFYNAFYENLIDTGKIDDKIVYSVELYNYYNRELYKKLGRLTTGTRIVTFHSLGEEIPPCYQLVEMQMDGQLKFWIKK